jgi:hypothetical protein
VLVRIGNDAAGKALASALGKSTGAQQITLVQALGDMHYYPAEKAVRALAPTNDANLRKAVLYSLAQIADPASEKILREAAVAANYKYEPTNALGSYVLFLNNCLLDKKKTASIILLETAPIPVSNAEMVTQSARKMLKVTSENTQIAAKTAALELLTLSAGATKAVGDVTGALKSSNKQ